MKYAMFLISLFFVCQNRALAQQDAQFAQYIFNGTHTNPAYAGYKEELYIQAFARAQWAGIRGAPQTLSISVDEAVKNESLGLGIIIDKDRIGAQNSLAAIGNLAYRIKLDRNETSVIAFGMGVGLKQMGLDGSLLDPKELGDIRVPSGNVSRITPELRAGVFYSTEKYFIGFSATNLLPKTVSVLSDYNMLNIRPQTHLYLTGGLALNINDNIIFRPSFLIKDDIKGPSSIDLNPFFLFKERFWLGMAYRTSLKLYNKDNLQKDLTRASTIGFITEYFASNNLRIGYGYDFGLNKASEYNNGSHEISLGYYFKTIKSRRPKCYF